MVNIISKLLEWVFSMRPNSATLGDVRDTSEWPLLSPLRSVLLHTNSSIQKSSIEARGTPFVQPMVTKCLQRKSLHCTFWISKITIKTWWWCLLISVTLSDCKHEILLTPTSEMPPDTHPLFSCNGFCIISLPMSASISEMPLVWLVWWVCPDVLCTLFNELTPALIIRDGSTVFLKTSSEVSIMTVVYLAAWICLNPSSPIPSAKERQLPKPRNDWFCFFSKALFSPTKDISMQVSTQPHFAFSTCVCLTVHELLK